MNCNNDCWNCKYEGCINLRTDDYKRSNTFDREEKRDREPIPTEQISTRRYNKSPKGRECRRRYLQTLNGKIHSRANSKRYYENHKETVLAYRKAWYEQNKDEIREKRKKRYRENPPIHTKEQKKKQAFWCYRRYFEKKNNRPLTEKEIEAWGKRYDLRAKKKEEKIG